MTTWKPTHFGSVQAMKEAMFGPPGTARRVSKIFREKWEELRGMYLDMRYMEVSRFP